MHGFLAFCGFFCDSATPFLFFVSGMQNFKRKAGCIEVSF